MTKNKKSNTTKLLVSVEKWYPETDKTEHVYVFELPKERQKLLHSILRQLFDHPNTDYSSRLRVKND